MAVSLPTRIFVTGEIHTAGHHNSNINGALQLLAAILNGTNNTAVTLAGLLTLNAGLVVNGDLSATGTININITGGLQSLTDDATITWDVMERPNATVTLAGNRTMAVPTNPREGQYYVLNVVQDATGSRTLTWDSVYTFDTFEGTAPALSPDANKIDKFGFAYEGGEMRCLGIIRDI